MVLYYKFPVRSGDVIQSCTGHDHAHITRLFPVTGFPRRITSLSPRNNPTSLQKAPLAPSSLRLATPLPPPTGIEVKNYFLPVVRWMIIWLKRFWCGKHRISRFWQNARQPVAINSCLILRHCQRSHHKGFESGRQWKLGFQQSTESLAEPMSALLPVVVPTAATVMLYMTQSSCRLQLRNTFQYQLKIHAKLARDKCNCLISMHNRGRLNWNDSIELDKSENQVKYNFLLHQRIGFKGWFFCSELLAWRCKNGLETKKWCKEWKSIRYIPLPGAQYDNRLFVNNFFLKMVWRKKFFL